MRLVGSILLRDICFMKLFRLSLLVVAYFLILGIRYFRKTEKSFVDII